MRHSNSRVMICTCTGISDQHRLFIRMENLSLVLARPIMPMDVSRVLLAIRSLSRRSTLASFFRPQAVFSCRLRLMSLTLGLELSVFMLVMARLHCKPAVRLFYREAPGITMDLEDLSALPEVAAERRRLQGAEASLLREALLLPMVKAEM